ncbi:MAG: DUF2760 domain-containing protein [Myxococcales bacterium FL481]|nr:MAG: DUF2760 domain-containing protein [Myxococcales bacterium FL481]
METPSFFARIGLALVAPFRLLFDGDFARAVAGIGSDAPRALDSKADEPRPAPTAPSVTESEPDHASALQLLAILQREGRFVDFLREDVAGFSDAEVGAAARVVHQGCARALDQHVQMAAIRTEGEGDSVELPQGFDAARVRVTGHVVGDPPFRGKLAHHGWEATRVSLPILATGHDPAIVAPAEVEL